MLTTLETSPRVGSADFATWMKAQREHSAYQCPEDGQQQAQECHFLQMYACTVGLVDFLTKNGTPGTSRLLVLFSILFFLYFLVMPGGASGGSAGPPTPQSVGKTLQCVKLIGVWRATSKTHQHDWLRRIANFQDPS